MGEWPGLEVDGCMQHTRGHTHGARGPPPNAPTDPTARPPRPDHLQVEALERGRQRRVVVVSVAAIVAPPAAAAHQVVTVARGGHLLQAGQARQHAQAAHLAARGGGGQRQASRKHVDNVRHGMRQREWSIACKLPGCMQAIARPVLIESSLSALPRHSNTGTVHERSSGRRRPAPPRPAPPPTRPVLASSPRPTPGGATHDDAAQCPEGPQHQDALPWVHAAQHPAGRQAEGFM